MAKRFTLNDIFLLSDLKENIYKSKYGPSKISLVCVLHYAKSSKSVNSKFIGSFVVVNN
tara:strand:- start:1118 stop:1294 length:177 start_codon:yes stop_codon:yes gene_type:complete